MTEVTVLREDENTFITQSKVNGHTVVRGTFMSKAGSALHIYCILDKESPEGNETYINLHLADSIPIASDPSLGTTIQDLIPNARKGFTSIAQGLPDDYIQAAALQKRNINILGNKMFGQKVYTLETVEVESMDEIPEDRPIDKIAKDGRVVFGAAFASPAEFFKHFLVTEEGRASIAPLLLDEETFKAANNFYKTVILDRNFVDHPDALKRHMLTRVQASLERVS